MDKSNWRERVSVMQGIEPIHYEYDGVIISTIPFHNTASAKRTYVVNNESVSKTFHGSGTTMDEAMNAILEDIDRHHAWLKMQ